MAVKGTEGEGKLVISGLYTSGFSEMIALKYWHTVRKVRQCPDSNVTDSVTVAKKLC